MPFAPITLSQNFEEMYKDTKKNANNFLKELGNPYDKIIFDNKGTNSIELGAYGVPESFLINKNRIIKKYEMLILFIE